MAQISKSLTLINEGFELKIPQDQDAIAGLQYGAGGLGTLVLEGTCDGITWIPFGLYPADGTAVVLNLAASGIAYARVGYVLKVRVRKSVAGAGAVLATLIVNYL